MRLAHLRHQLLIAMGVPACWTQQVPEATSQAAKPAVPTDFERAACPRDTVPETVCGAREEDLPRCAPRGDSLASYDDTKLYITEESGEKVTYRRFVFDRKATDGYRTLLAADGVAVTDHCCYSHCTPLVVGNIGVTGRPGDDVVTRCLPYPPGGTSVPAHDDPACPAGVRFEGALRPYAATDDKTCCYSVPLRKYEMRVVPGRPARVDGEARFASVGAVDATGGGAGSGHAATWRAPELAPSVASLPRELRDRLAAVWLEAARAEHASIASFANLSLRLLALGAPPDLVADAHAAALDEIRHARLAFELASAYAGTALQPVRFDDAARMSAAGDLASLAIETLLDGCINETVAAVEAETAGAAADDPVVAATLREIAADEARHAELAWRIVAWCVRSGEPGLLAALHEVAASVASAISAPAGTAGDLASHGVLGAEAQATARAGVLREIVAPCLAALAA